MFRNYVYAAEARERQRAAKTRQAHYYNRHVRERPTLETGDTVRFQVKEGSEWQKGEIVKVLPHRSYEVKTDDGTVKRRTTKHVRFTNEPKVIMDDTSIDIYPSVRDTSLAPKLSANRKQNQRASVTIGNNNRDNYVTRSGRTVNKPQRYRK